MTVWELQKMSGKEVKGILSRMSSEEIEEVIESCGKSQFKAVVRKLWERSTGNKY